eukprot:gb/GFBE01028380.1/.p1 GENE.gb/GFBE01028380.1/~~gb/GFBE01028380.1/.p1  ORF type:complete len:677 (+),score=103.92 gb/GFBE01028380.1/:1-2031(+)
MPRFALLGLPLLSVSSSGETLHQERRHEACHDRLVQRRAASLDVFRAMLLEFKHAKEADPNRYLRPAKAAVEPVAECPDLVEDIAIKATRDFVRGLGPLGRRINEHGPWCSLNFDLEWWEEENFTGALFQPHYMHLSYKLALKDTVKAFTRCNAGDRYFPSGGTLIALARYGSLSGHLGEGLIDHVDKDIDISVILDDQQSFVDLWNCVRRELSQLSGGWACSDLQVARGRGDDEDSWEPWFFHCVLVRYDRPELFGNAVELHVGRYFTEGDAIVVQKNCRSDACREVSEEFGSLSKYWNPWARCQAYDMYIPCPRSPGAVLSRVGEYSDQSTGTVAIPAIAPERCSYDPWNLKMLREGMKRRHMHVLRWEAQRLHSAGAASFWDSWFFSDGTPRPLPKLDPYPTDTRHQASDKYEFRGREQVGVSCPVWTFFLNFLALIPIWLISVVDQPHHSDYYRILEWTKEISVCVGYRIGSLTIHSVLSYKPLLKQAASNVLSAARSEGHLAILWETLPVVLCAAYFVDAALHCSIPRHDQEHARAGQLCRSWVSSSKSDIVVPEDADGAVRDLALLQLLALIAGECKDIGRRLGSYSAIFRRWDGSFQRALRRLKPRGIAIERRELKLESYKFLIRQIYLLATDQKARARIDSQNAAVCYPTLYTGADQLLLVNVSGLYS